MIRVIFALMLAGTVMSTTAMAQSHHQDPAKTSPPEMVFAIRPMTPTR
jgi:hypothetical protein